jgi:dihydroorotate dehydrogenase electron transfer subunit
MSTHAHAALPLRADATVVANRCEGGANHRIRLTVPGWPGAAPGHFVMLSAGGRGAALRFDPLLPRPMAVYRSLAAGTPEIEVLYKATGRGTRLLAETRAGEVVRVVGPLGTPFTLPEAGRRALLVGGGTGIASLYELAAQARARGPVVVLLGARGVGDLMGAEDFAALDVELRVATEDGSSGTRGRVTDLLQAALDEPGAANAIVYACGPTPMMQRAAEIAAKRDVPCQVSLENRMACGFGVCLGCAVPRADGSIALVCRDGPVFDAGLVGWAGVP